MSTPVTFNGLSVNVPENGDQGWGSDVSALLIELANNAAVTSSLTQNVRVATNSPVTILNTDFAVGINVAGVATVNLPSGAGSVGQIFVIYDASGAAYTNNITINPSSGETIGGQSSYVMSTNNGAVVLQYDNTTWSLLSETTSFIKAPLRYAQSATNSSYVSAGILGGSSFPSVTNLQSSTGTFSGSNAIQFVVSLNSGESFVGFTTYNSSRISALSDPDSIFLASDSGTGIYVSKGSGSGVLTFKNRMGSSKNIEIKALTTQISTLSAWS